MICRSFSVTWDLNEVFSFLRPEIAASFSVTWDLSKVISLFRLEVSSSLSVICRLFSKSISAFKSAISSAISDVISALSVRSLGTTPEMSTRHSPSTFWAGIFPACIHRRIVRWLLPSISAALATGWSLSVGISTMISQSVFVCQRKPGWIRVRRPGTPQPPTVTIWG